MRWFSPGQLYRLSYPTMCTGAPAFTVLLGSDPGNGFTVALTALALARYFLHWRDID